MPGSSRDPIQRWRPGGLRPGGLPPSLPAQPRSGPAAQGHQGADVSSAPEESQREGEAADEDPGRCAAHTAQLPAARLQPAGTAPHQNTDPQVHHQVHQRTDGAPQQRQAGVGPGWNTCPGTPRICCGRAL